MRKHGFKPAAFMSYDHNDDWNDRLSKLRELLEISVRNHTGGKTFKIFQDKRDIKWGEDWKDRIKESLNEVTFFIPILTPSFFNSQYCRFELETFLNREKMVNRKDLILPIYYMDTPILDDDTKRENDPLAKEIRPRIYLDWRDFRNCAIESREFTSSPESKPIFDILDGFAKQIGDALSKAVITIHPHDQSANEGSTATFNIEANGDDLAYQWQQSIDGGKTFSNIPGATHSSYTTPILTSNYNGGVYRIIVKGGNNDCIASNHAALSIIKDAPLREVMDSKESKTTWVVDPKHKGEITTITKAISLAKAEDTIHVRPGIYDESLLIDKPLEIIGDGELGEIVIRTSGTSVVQFKSTFGCFSNMALQQLSGGNWPCVNISQGRLELHDCDITSHSSSCIAIGNAEPNIHDNIIHDGNDIGILLSKNSGGIIENNKIFGNALAGVEIRGKSNPRVLRNKIYDGKGPGILVSKGGSGIIENNEIYGNALGGVEIIDGGNPNVMRNEIHDGKGVGISICRKGKGNIEENEIYNNALEGVEIKEEGNPIIRRNKLRDGQSKGFTVSYGGLGTIEENEVFGHKRAGVEITEGGNPKVHHNRIHDGKDCGILISKNGAGIMEDNYIFNNAFPAVVISDGGNPILRRNLIYDGQDMGIFIYNKGMGLIEDNKIYNNNHAGVAISGKSNPKIRYNRISDGKLSGILIYKNGEGIIEDNTISGNAHSGVEITEEGNPTLYRNRIDHGKNVGILIAESGLGLIEDNDISNNAQAGVEIREFACPIMKGNRINKNGNYGIFIHDNGGGTIVKNDLRDNSHGPFELQDWDISSPPPNRPKLTVLDNLE